MNFEIENLKFDEHGLLPAIVQDAGTREILTLAYMNAESLRRTIAEKQTWFWSRSRSELWHKGETSGHTQQVSDIILDCDLDAIVVQVQPNGPACHTGDRSCFHNGLVQAAKFDVQAAITAGQPPPFAPTGSSSPAGAEAKEDLGALLESLYSLIESRRRERPDGSYTAYLFNAGLDKILKKVGEESTETIVAAKNDDRGELAAEASDLLYHLLVLLVERGITLREVQDELVSRAGKKGK